MYRVLYRVCYNADGTVEGIRPERNENPERDREKDY
jgi:hypothetical protein